VLAVLALAACGSDDDSGGDTTASTPATPTTEAAPPAGAECKTVDAPAPKSGATAKKPGKDLDPAKTYTVEFVTSCGNFTVELDVKGNPKTAS
jgi:hypothetical protein